MMDQIFQKLNFFLNLNFYNYFEECVEFVKHITCRVLLPIFFVWKGGGDPVSHRYICHLRRTHAIQIMSSVRVIQIMSAVRVIQIMSAVRVILVISAVRVI